MAANGGTSVNNSSQFSGDPNSRKGRLIQRYAQLDKMFQPWRSHYIELSDFSQPRRGTHLRTQGQGSDSNRGRVRNNKIIDNKATMGIRTLTAGLLAGLASPSRPWFRLRMYNDDLMQHDEVKEWVQAATYATRAMVGKSNFYATLSNVLTDLGIFGTSVMYRQPNITHSSLVYRCFKAGEYRIAENYMGDVDTVARKFMMSVGQIVDRFVVVTETGEKDWSKCSQKVAESYRMGQYDTEYEICHIIQPRRKRDASSPWQMDMEFESVYFEMGGDHRDNEKVLYEGGYSKFPCYVPRWRTNDEVYGESPLMDALGDVKQLQQQHRRKGQAIEKNINPPYVANTQLKNRPSSSLPGAITYVTGENVGQMITPIHTPNPYIRELSEDMKEVHTRIGMALYEPLFAQFAFNSPYGDKMTAEEIMKRDAERLVLLTPTLQNISRALLAPAIKDVVMWGILESKIPEPPPIVEDYIEMTGGGVLDIEFVSVLALAQEAVYANVIERVMAFGGNLVQLAPGILDNIDIDESFRRYARNLGYDEGDIRDMSDVMEMRKQRAEEEQQAQMQEALLGGGAESASKAALNLAQIDGTGGQALDTSNIPAQGQV